MEWAGNKVAATVVAADGRDRPKKLPYSRSAPIVQQKLAAKNPPPQPKQKHQVYYELIEADNTKKKLKFEVTADSTPPAGYEFIPIGNPEITALCKDLSRENGMTIYMVSSAQDLDNPVAVQMTRFGHHFPVSIVEEAQMELGYYPNNAGNHGHGQPEPIPETQEAINAQADAAIRDLFPRIPNTDRQEIIDHSFRKGKIFNGVPVVGLSANIPLSRRVQLAVLAHIRHNHTRYDELLRQTTWAHARKTVESACLEILVKWRGDEENGRDELETILREVVVISDSEDDDEDADESDNDQSDDSISTVLDALDSPNVLSGAETDTVFLQPGHPRPEPLLNRGMPSGTKAAATKAGPPPTFKRKSKKALRRERRAERKAAKAAKRAQRGFKRYQAAWDQAVNRIRQQGNKDASPVDAVGMTRRSARDRSYPQQLAVSSGHDVPQPVHSPAGHEIAAPGPFGRYSGSESNPIRVDDYGRFPDHHAQPDFEDYAPSVQLTSGQNEALPVGYGPRHLPPVSPQPPPTAGNRFQDLLVPSIEPPSPDARSMQPQFIRSLPPRKHSRDDYPDRQPAIQRHDTNSPQYSPQYHDGSWKRRRMVGEVEEVGRYPVDSQSFRSQHDRAPQPSHVERPMADLYSNARMSTPPSNMYGPGNHDAHHEPSRAMPQGYYPPPGAVLPPLRTRCNPIDLDSPVVHPQPVVVSRVQDWDTRPREEHRTVRGRPLMAADSRRMHPSESYYGPIDDLEYPPHTFAVERSRHVRQAAQYGPGENFQPHPAPVSSEPIYIRTLEPRSSLPRASPVQQLPLIMSTGAEAGRPGTSNSYARNVHYEDGRPVTPIPVGSGPGPYHQREPALMGSQHRGSPRLAPYPQRDIPPPTNIIVLE